MKKFVIAAALIAVSSGSAFAAGNTSTANGTATATVVAPLVLTHTSGASLTFGTFVPSTAGTVTITAAGAATYSGPVAMVTNTYSADAFTVSGDTTRTFTIATTGSTLTGPGTAMTFTTTPSAATGTLAAGAASFTVGGVLTVPPTQTAGSYTGTYTATVTYN